MKFFKKKAFILNYIGSLIVIFATIAPIITINQKNFSLLDQYLIRAIIIACLQMVIIILTSMKQHKISLIPTILSILLVGFCIFQILNIEGLKTTPGLSYGIAFILYPIGLVFNLIGGIFSISKDNKQEISKDLNAHLPIKEEKIDDNIQNNLDNNENINEQIPLESLSKNTSIPDISNNNPLNTSTEEILEEIIESDIVTPNVANSYQNNNENLESISTNNVQLNNTESTSNNIFSQTNLNTDYDDMLNNMPENNIDTSNTNKFLNNSNLNDNLDELILVDDNTKNIDNDLIMDDIVEEKTIEPSVNNSINDNFEIPDIDLSDNSLMMNNTQVEDKPKQEFMAINPSDMKIDEKKSLFKKKEKEQPVEDPIAKIMNRNVPMTQGRVCMFCNTPLGDDERICPLCGRIN